MRAYLLNIFSYVLLSFLFNRCAQIGVLTGGDKDTAPPVLKMATPLNQSLNFQASNIVLLFDENVQLKDLPNHLLISPKMKTSPEITAQGKKILIKLKQEELLPNTTYILYFGNAIADMHEGNLLSNFSYVFSTGDVIDTLVFKGKVESALEKQPEKDVIVGLYFTENLHDSFPFKQTPDYLSRTNSSGEFAIGNLPPKNFELVCFIDKNKDYMYNSPETESIGFNLQTINPLVDTSVNLRLFKEMPNKIFVRKNIMNEYGKGIVIYNQQVKIKLNPFVAEQNQHFSQLNPERESDTCIFYYRELKDSLWLLSYLNDNTAADTLKLKVPTLKVRSRKILKPLTNFTGGSVSYFAKPYLDFGHWINPAYFKEEGVSVSSAKDTLVNLDKNIFQWVNPGKLELNYDFKPKTDYIIQADTSIFYTYHGYHNDSLKLKFNLLGKNEFGKLNLNITFSKKQSYIIQLLQSNNSIAQQGYAAFSLSSSNKSSFSFGNLSPGMYQVRIIYDNNENKKWDTGNFLMKEQPESVYLYEKKIKVIADWEVEEEILLKE